MTWAEFLTFISAIYAWHLPEATSTVVWSKFILPVGNLLIISRSKLPCVLQLQSSQLSPTFTIPEVMESWAGYGNETKHTTHTDVHVHTVKQNHQRKYWKRWDVLAELNEWYSRWGYFLLGSVWTATTLLCTARCLNTLALKNQIPSILDVVCYLIDCYGCV